MIDIESGLTTVIGNAGGGGSLTFQSSLRPTNYCMDTVGSGLCGDGASLLHVGKNYISFEIDTLVGSGFSMRNLLIANVVVGGSAQAYVGRASAHFDALNTAHTYFSIAGQDAFLVAESGTDYSLPVESANGIPEPATLALCLFGLLGICGAQRRKYHAMPAIAS